MGDLAEAVRQLAGYYVKSPALIVRAPQGEYVISPDGSGNGTRDQFVVSRSQLGTLMWENGVRREDLADPRTAATLASLVDQFRAPQHRSGEAT